MIRADPAIIDTFYVLDFDHCLGDTNKLHSELEESIERLTDISLTQLAAARLKVERAGDSFDTASYVMELLAAKGELGLWDRVVDDMVWRAKQGDMLEPHAANLLWILDQKNARYGILTYGGKVWQEMKINGAGLGGVPKMITDIHAKGQIMAGWKQADGTFRIPVELAGGDCLVAKSLVLVDDKAKSFQDIPPGVRGVRIAWTNREIMPSQRGSVPVGVETASGMIGAIELLFGLDSVKVIDKT